MVFQSSISTLRSSRRARQPARPHRGPLPLLSALHHRCQYPILIKYTASLNQPGSRAHPAMQRTHLLDAPMRTKWPYSRLERLECDIESDLGEREVVLLGDLLDLSEHGEVVLVPVPGAVVLTAVYSATGSESKSWRDVGKGSIRTLPPSQGLSTNQARPCLRVSGTCP